MNSEQEHFLKYNSGRLAELEQTLREQISYAGERGIAIADVPSKTPKVRELQRQFVRTLGELIHLQDVLGELSAPLVLASAPTGILTVGDTSFDVHNIEITAEPSSAGEQVVAPAPDPAPAPAGDTDPAVL